jgi:hypothetical protein
MLFSPLACFPPCGVAAAHPPLLADGLLLAVSPDPFVFIEGGLFGLVT